MAVPESPDAALESLVGQIADEFTRRHLRGEGPALEEYTQRYPELAGLLRDILPTIQALSPPRGPAAAETRRSHETPPARSPLAPREAGIPLAEREGYDLADYEILAEIGRGGMGVVYKARHRTLGRIVALKMLRSHDAADLERFRREAEAVARLQHPNVVQIFEVREAEGRPFLALEYVDGGSLAERTKGEPQPPRQAAALVETSARAMAAAHERGLVHRDLKPGNILLASGGRQPPDDAAPSTNEPSSGGSPPPLAVCIPKITDFGLAKRLDQDLGQTQSGAIVGTPSYMAPEQALGGASVGPAADIFALGAILYELIAGRPPFKGPSVLETLELVRHAEPTPPAQLQPGCPRDLETICLKSLQKDPTRRYASAALLADDLQRFLRGEPIQARPVGGVERLGKWLRRRPAVAASIGLAALALVALVALTVRLTYSWELEDANQKLEGAVGAKETALLATHEARRIAEHNHQEADAARTKLDAALERERALHYIHSINLAQREWEANRVDEARRVLDACPRDLRHWEWRYLHRQCHIELMTIRGHVGSITALAVSPDGKLIAAASNSSRSQVKWDLKVWNAATGQLALALLGHEHVIADVAFSPDGSLLASASHDRTIRLWNLHQGGEPRKITGATPFRCVRFSPDGKRLAAAADERIRLFDVATGAELLVLAGHNHIVRSLAFSGDGARLVSGGFDRFVKLWDLSTRKEIFSTRAHSGPTFSVAFNPQEDQIVSCGSGAVQGTVAAEVRLWNAHDGRLASPAAMTFPFRLSMAAFSADAAHIACGAGDGTVLFLDAQTGHTAFTFRGHAHGVGRLVFAPGGSRLITGSDDGTIRVWPVERPEFVDVAQQSLVATALAFAGDGGQLAFGFHTARPERSGVGLRVMPVPAQGEHRDVGPTPGTVKLQAKKAVLALAVAPDQRWLAAAEVDVVHLWNLEKPALRGAIAEPGVVDMSISPDGLLLATATHNPDVDLRPDLLKSAAKADDPRQTPAAPPVPAIKIWRALDGGLVRVLPGQISVAFSPDGRRLAGACDRGVKVWDVATGQELYTFSGSAFSGLAFTGSAFTGLADPVLKVQFVAGGKQVVGFTHRRATVWDADSGEVIAAVDGLQGPALVTPDGQRIVSIHRGLLKWWDVQLGRELLFLPLPETAASAAAMPSADGRRVLGGFGLLTLSADGQRLAAAGGNRLMLWQAGAP